MMSVVLDTRLPLPPALPTAVGFRNGTSSSMTSRTIMVAELHMLFAALPATASLADYRTAIVDENVLLKRSATTRRASARYLIELYTLDLGVPLFRILRSLWDQDAAGRPLLASLCANARDALLRRTAQAVLPLPFGMGIASEDLSRPVSEAAPHSFNVGTLGKIARNAASSWTQSGHLAGHRSKARVRAQATPASAAYALALGYLAGARGTFLFQTYWTALLDVPADVLDSMAFEAGRHGWITYRRIGDVVDLGFSDLLDARKGVGV